MRWEFDTEAGSLYVYLGDGEVDRQEEMPDGLVVDVDTIGRPIGVEVLSAWAPFSFREVASHYELDENVVASLDFLRLTVVSQINARPDLSTLVRAESPTASSAPARVLSATG